MILSVLAADFCASAGAAKTGSAAAASGRALRSFRRFIAVAFAGDRLVAALDAKPVPGLEHENRRQAKGLALRVEKGVGIFYLHEPSLADLEEARRGGP